MAATNIREAPSEWLNRIWYSIGAPREDFQIRNMKRNREKVVSWAQDKQARMTPWGVQYLSPELGEWVPYLHGLLDATVCGRWIREQPHQCVNCGGSARCQAAAPRVGIPYCLGDLTYAVQNPYLADPTINLSSEVKMEVPPPKTDRCRITELPTELLQHIISFLVPSGTTYQFFPTRLDTTRSLQIAQKFTPQPAVKQNAPPAEGVMKRFQAVRYNMTDRPPATGTAHVGLAATCQRLQHEMYAAFFGGNSFVLHLTAGTIQNSVRSRDFRLFQTWTRILPGQSRTQHSTPWPLSSRAASYLRNLILIISLPPAPVSKDLDTLEAKVSETMETLSAAVHLDKLSIDFQQSTQKRDKRYTSQILDIDSLEAAIGAGGKLNMSIHEPKVQTVRTWNKAQRVLRPLLQGPKGVKEVVLSGPISDDLVEELQSALRSAPNHNNNNMSTARRSLPTTEQHNPTEKVLERRPSKRQRVT